MSDVQTTPGGDRTAVASRRADPLASLREDMDHLMRRVWHGSPVTGLDWPRTMISGWAAPAIDFAESDQGYTITAEMPGMDKDDVEISVHDGVLVLSGEKRSSHDETRESLQLSERRFGQFQRSFSLPSDASDGKIDARFENGVLRITIPRTPGKTASTRIKIK